VSIRRRNAILRKRRAKPLFGRHVAPLTRCTDIVPGNAGIIVLRTRDGFHLSLDFQVVSDLVQTVMAATDGSAT
jgi:hypothetical protein